PNRPGWALSGSFVKNFALSPDVHADRTITFRIVAPTAPVVNLIFADHGYPMTKDDKGVWSATLGPFEPDIYGYSFDIGGANVNPDAVEVPGNPTPRYDELQDAPHGSMTFRTYSSKIHGMQRTFRVYLPPQYYSEPHRKFPVLYFFYGLDDPNWTSQGKIDVVMDNLIAAHKATPMIVVEPNSWIHGETVLQRQPYADKATTKEAQAGFSSSAETVAVLEKELPQEIMPIIKRDYRVYTDRAHTAIAGLSYGGGTAFGIGMRHLGWFDYVGEFCTGTFGGLDNPKDGYISYAIPYDAESIAPGIYKNLVNPATKPKLFYMGCGEQDPRRPFQEKALADFRAHGIDPVWQVYPGAHEWKYFRRAFADFAGRIFK
ncbi:MAG TPA: alpha/beta hydrolase-fold protein, partial [Caulobacteraceae bacterium]|nr:alpha/beta hydrolase-fold protein [Caulobacteraceae bacterium]